MPKTKPQPTLYDVVSGRDGERVVIGLTDSDLAASEAARLTAEAISGNPEAHAVYEAVERRDPEATDSEAGA